VGGPAIAAGDSYHERIIAFVYVHILSETPLRWFERDDVPVAVEPEVGGVGDDIRIEIRAGLPHPEVQSKHGIHAGRQFADAVRTAATRPGARPTPVRFAADHCSGQTLLQTYREALDRLRTGRADPLPPELIALRAELGEDHWIWAQMGIVQCEVAHDGDDAVARALTTLEWLLQDSRSASTAWGLLCQDASDLITRRLRRDRPALVALLAGADGRSFRRAECPVARRA